MQRPLCCACEMLYKVERNGVVVIEWYQGDKEIYKVWNCDLHKCPGCGNMVVGGWAEQAVKQTGIDSEVNIADYLILKKKAGVPIFNWKEKRIAQPFGPQYGTK